MPSPGDFAVSMSALMVVPTGMCRAATTLLARRARTGISESATRFSAEPIAASISRMSRTSFSKRCGCLGDTDAALVAREPDQDAIALPVGVHHPQIDVGELARIGRGALQQ